MVNILLALGSLNDLRIVTHYITKKGLVSLKSADVKAAEEFLETLDVLIVEENYLPEQIFSMDETSIFWKQMSERTFIY